MSTVQEIRTAIEALSPAERAELERALHAPAEPGPKEGLRLPDYAARRKKIYGNRVLPNPVLEAREQALA